MGKINLKFKKEDILKYFRKDEFVRKDDIPGLIIFVIGFLIILGVFFNHRYKENLLANNHQETKGVITKILWDGKWRWWRYYYTFSVNGIEYSNNTGINNLIDLEIGDTVPVIYFPEDPSNNTSVFIKNRSAEFGAK